MLVDVLHHFLVDVLREHVPQLCINRALHAARDFGDVQGKLGEVGGQLLFFRTFSWLLACSYRIIYLAACTRTSP